MSKIQFASDSTNSQPTRIFPNGASPAVVHSTRSAARSSGLSEKHGTGDVDVEDGDENDPKLYRESDIKHKQVFRGWVLFWLAYQSTGVIYGDIGTSPLYVFSSTFSSSPSYDDLLGALSLIIWTLTLIVTIKYVFIVLRADDEGEGGTFAIFSLLSRYANILQRDPKEASMIKMERYLSSDIGASGRTIRNGIENSRFAKALLKLLGVLGVALIMADGVLTPAQSVLGAIQGVTVVNPNVSTNAVIGISCAILVLLFMIQPLGVSKLASSFAPIVIVWLSFLAGFGIYNLVHHDHSVLKAFSPHFAGDYLVRNGTDGWRSLGGILLCFTGVEALFADLGAFSMSAIQLSWLCFTFPCLLLGYIGQAAYISDDPAAYSSPFFNTVPPGCLYPGLIIAVLAAIVASQAIITSTFQLLTQIMKLSYFPQIKTVHTSKTFHGQVYVPVANWLLMIGTVIVTAVYNNTTRLGNAYGVCVILVTFITTCMVAIVAVIIWRLNIFLVLFVWLVFALLDGVYLSSVLTKVSEGAWFTLALAFVLSSIFILWRFGKEQQWQAEAEDRFQPSHLVTEGGNGLLYLSPAFGGNEVSSIKGFGVFFDKVGDMTPTVFIQFLSKFAACPEIMILLHLRPISRPSVPPEERYTVTRTSISNCFRFIIRHGYTDEVITGDLSTLILEEIRNFIIRDANRTRDSRSPLVKENGNAGSPASPLTSALASSDRNDETSNTNADITNQVASRLRQVQEAYEKQVVYIMGKEQMHIRAKTKLFRRIVLNCFLWIRENSRSKMANMKIPTDQLVEVGFVKEV